MRLSFSTQTPVPCSGPASNGADPARLGVGRGWRSGLVYAGVTGAALLYMGEGIIVPLRFLGFVLGVLLPAAALISGISGVRDLEAAGRAAVGLALAMLTVTPLFFLRREVPVPTGIFDLVLVLSLCFTAARSGSYMRLLGDLRSPIFRALRPWMFVALPILFALTWMGFEVREGSQVVYYGLYPVDFANLTSTVGLINASRGLPHWPVAGSEVVNYHWLFFAFPAWLSSFGGGHSPHSDSLEICNFAAACLLLATLCVAAEAALNRADARLAPVTVALAGAVVAFASILMHPYVVLVGMAVRLTHISALGIAGRNALLLSMANSMTVFGNNTFAATLALLTVCMLLQWNRTLRVSYLIVGALFLVSIVGYSVTLFFPMAMAVGTWLLLGRVRRWWMFVFYYGIIGAAGIAIFDFGLHLFGKSKGLALAFDHGYYLRHLFFAFFPLWWLAWLGRSRTRELGLLWVVIAAAVLAPSFLYVPDTQTGQYDFSMKIATLIAAAAMPMVCAGLERCRENWRRPGALVALLLVGTGAICTAAYAGQFAVMRVRQEHDRAMSLPADYVAALKFIRDHTSPYSIIIDAEAMPIIQFVPTVSIGERRLYVTKHIELTQTMNSILSAEISRRKEDYEKWSAGQFRDPDLSRQFAEHADVFVAKWVPFGTDWVPLQKIGVFTICRSTFGTPEGRGEIK